MAAIPGGGSTVPVSSAPRVVAKPLHTRALEFLIAVVQAILFFFISMLPGETTNPRNRKGPRYGSGGAPDWGGGGGGGGRGTRGNVHGLPKGCMSSGATAG